jgi:hypothetical protein
MAEVRHHWQEALANFTDLDVPRPATSETG